LNCDGRVTASEMEDIERAIRMQLKML
jgi:hypothetical protein